jgi:hypothetical protein
MPAYVAWAVAWAESIQPVGGDGMVFGWATTAVAALLPVYNRFCFTQLAS